MKRIAFFTLAVLLAGACLAGCSTRSISDSGYRASSYRADYRGELNELAVLGATDQGGITEEMIQAAMAGPREVSLRRGDTVVLVQSGARFPDEPMMEAMARYFDIIPLSGVPEQPAAHGRHMAEAPDQRPLDRALRLSAARAGAGTLIVYWGVLESGIENEATKTVSWVPVVGRLVPDESQQMRIRLKAAVIDVATGNWVMLTPETFGDRRLSARVNRESADQAQVALLKEKAYTDFANTLLAQLAERGQLRAARR